jgi:quercetin dioxygenase-like cupin family protein
MMRNSKCCEGVMKPKRADRAAWLACLALIAGVSGGMQPVHAAGPDYTTRGLSAAQLARLPGVTYARPLLDLPERNLVVVHLTFPPKRGALPSSQACPGHRHPGPATVRVTRGALRLGLAGQPVQIVRAGGIFYEPANSLHTVAESASSVEPAAAVALLVLPKGAPILIPDDKCGARSSR